MSMIYEITIEIILINHFLSFGHNCKVIYSLANIYIKSNESTEITEPFSATPPSTAFNVNRMR